MFPWSRSQNVCSMENVISATPDEIIQKQMLKKGNILQYPSNSFQLTKAQRYSYYSRRGTTTSNCELKRYYYTPTTSSDVPGPSQLLFWDSVQPTFIENVSAKINTAPQTIDYSTLQRAPNSC